MKLIRLAAYGGVAGPVLFTAAWVVSSLRQAGHPATEVQLSGLAAIDARDPQLMMAAFVVLGCCSIGLGAALRTVAGAKSAGPWLVMAAGAATAAAGVFRRDHMLLTGPGFAGESWHNQVHDVVSGVAYGAMLAAPLLLAGAFALTQIGPFSPARFRFLRSPARWPWRSSHPGRCSRGTALCSGPRSRSLSAPRSWLPHGC